VSDAFSDRLPAVRRLRLTDFRNHAALSLELPPRHVALVGPNGIGKTNILEALSFLSPGRGLRRAAYDAIAREDGPGGWSVAIRLDGAEGTVDIGTGLSPDAGGGRQIRIDGTPARAAEALADHCSVTWLTPAMDGLFTGTAGDRRRFLDRMVLALDPGHGRRVASYERAMRQRNRLVEDPSSDPSWLDGLEAQMAELGTAVAHARADLVAALSAAIAAAAEGGSDFPRAVLALEGFATGDDLAGPAGDFEDSFAASLAAARPRDRAAGRTTEGPHRTDLVVTHAEKAILAAKASTGEQKALLVGLVLAHAALVAERRGHAPLLLLDEIAAHLDSDRRAALFDRIDALGSQAVMTGTDANLFEALGPRAETVTLAA
jgi:DNA replication and repair protein RecF